MIQTNTRLHVADNTGAKDVGCIRVVGKAKVNSAEVGNIIIGSVKQAVPHANIKKKEIVRAVIIRQKKPIKRKDGTSIRFDDNAIVLINPDNTPRGTRIFGPVAREIREAGLSKIVSMATEVL